VDDPYHINGLFLGQLTDQEGEWFNSMVAQGKAMRVYEGEAGFLGLAKVCLTLVGEPICYGDSSGGISPVSLSLTY
jgi:hypothetical protein